MADRSISYAFRADIGDFTAKVAAMGKSVKDFATELTDLDTEGEQLRNALGDLADQAAQFGIAAAAGYTAANVASANFEQSISSVRAATNETAGNMERFKQAALSAGAETAYSASEAAAAIENLAKAGISTADILDGALNGSLDLAAAGQLDVAAAAEYTATALTQFQLEGGQASHVADLLAAGAGKAQGEVADLANALNYAGIPAANLGVSIEETTGTLALFAKNGLIGSEAGTSLRGMLASLTSPSEVAKQQMEKLGISVFDARGQFIGFEGVAGQLQDRLSGFSDKSISNSLGKIFGTEQLQAANILLREGAAGVAEWARNVNDAGYAANAAGIQLDNLHGDLEQLRGAVETALIGTGQGQQGILRDLTQDVTTLVNAYSGLPDPVHDATGALLGVTAITTGGFWLSTKAVNSIAATRGALEALGLQAATTRQLLRSVAGGGRAFTAVAATLFDTIGQLDTWNRHRAAADATTKSYEDLAEALKDSNVGKYADDLDIDLARLTQDLYENGEAGDYVTRIQGELNDSMSGLGNGLKAISGDILPIYNSSVNKAYDLHQDLNEIIDGSADVLGTAGDEAKKTALAEADLSGAALQLAESSKTSAEDVEALAAAMKQAKETASDAVNGFLDLDGAIKDGEFSFERWIKALRKSGNAVRDFRKNADTAGDRGLDPGLVTFFEAQGTEGALQLEYFATATKRELEQANRAWRRFGYQAGLTVETVTNDLVTLGNATDLPDIDLKADVQLTAFQQKMRMIMEGVVGINGLTADPIANLDTSQFDASFDALFADLQDVDKRRIAPILDLDGTTVFEARLDALLRPRTLKVGLSLSAIGAAVAGPLGAILGAAVGQADGGTVSGPRWPYGDKVFTALAPGEEVITNKNGEADRFRADRAAGRIPAYSGGGTVDWDRVDAGRRSARSYPAAASVVAAPVLSDNDLNRIVSALATVRPMYGDVYQQPHDYNQFRLQMDDDRRRASLGGIPSS